MVAAQVGLYAWKKYHGRSFQGATLLLLWIIPFGWSLNQGYTRMMIVWLIFSGMFHLILLTTCGLID
jgi:hypothetical protein